MKEKWSGSANNLGWQFRLAYLLLCNNISIVLSVETDDNDDDDDDDGGGGSSGPWATK